MFRWIRKKDEVQWRVLIDEHITIRNLKRLTHFCRPMRRRVVVIGPCIVVAACTL